MASKVLDRVYRILPEWLRQFVQLTASSVSSWLEHRASSKGAALSFYTLFSVSPILVLAIAVAGYFFGEAAARGQLLGELRTLMGENGAEAIQALLAAASNPDSGRIATLVATLLLIVGATSVFAELKASLDELWEVEDKQEGGIIGLIKTRLLSFGLVLVLAFLLMVSLVVNAALKIAEQYIGGIWTSSAGLLTSISTLVSYGVIAFLFAVIYKMLPATQIAWRDVWIGAGVTAALFVVGKYLIGLYLGNSAVTSGFGAAGSLIALMLWVYYSAQIFFLGAEFTRQFALTCGSQCPTRRNRNTSQ
ncbi:MAG TPA: YihY/virulence factor BrkB family protein [Methylophilaceae bacterium]|nr:YihY/virulence factor BrkB family protein [Methylophilaceae bacterium]